METIQEKIDRFRDYFRKQLGLVNALDSNEDYRAHRKLLYIAIIDALSKSIYPDKRNRKRIVSLINDFADWEHSKQVSLPHLNQLLSFTSDHDFDPVKVYVSSELNRWGPLNVHSVSIIKHPGDVLVPIARDPESKHIAALWPSENGKPKLIQGIGWIPLQHIELFYTYRNQLMHEFLEPGGGMESQQMMNHIINE